MTVQQACSFRLWRGYTLVHCEVCNSVKRSCNIDDWHCQIKCQKVAEYHRKQSKVVKKKMVMSQTLVTSSCKDLKNARLWTCTKLSIHMHKLWVWVWISFLPFIPEKDNAGYSQLVYFFQTVLTSAGPQALGWAFDSFPWHFTMTRFLWFGVDTRISIIYY